MMTLLALLAIAVVWQFNRLLNDLHIEQLSYRVETIGLHTIRFSELSFTHNSEKTQETLHLQNLHITWQWPHGFLPQINTLIVEQVGLTQTQLASLPTAAGSQSAFSLPNAWPVPENFPEKIHIQHLQVRLPDLAVLAGVIDIHKIKMDSNTAGLEINLQISSGDIVHSEPQLLLKATYGFAQKTLTGRLLLEAKTSAPVQIPNLGTFSGYANIDIDIAAGQFNHYGLSGEINAEQLTIPERWQAIGLNADSLHIKISSNANANANVNANANANTNAMLPEALAVAFSGNTQGAVQTTIEGKLIVNALAKKVTLEKLALSAIAKKINPQAGVELNNMHLNLTATGLWPFDGDDKLSPQISSDASLSVDSVIHPLFKRPQAKNKPWRWEGKLQGSVADFDVNGLLTLGTSLAIQHHATRKFSKLQIDWRIPDIFLLAANPFADALNDWPPLLSLTRGKINAKGNVLFDIEKENNRFINSQSEIQLLDLSGIYDTMAFQGLSSHLRINTNAQIMQIATDELTLKQLDKGFILGPLVAAAKYQANLNKLMQGKLSLQQFNGTVMDGSISTTAQEFDFSHETQHFLLTLNAINLATLLQQYPSSELSGSGKLSGTVPVEMSSKGFRIAKGRVSAETPGGQLKYTSERANTIAKTQPSMKLITQALDDFHYSVLSSEVNYDEKGKLLLSVRLEGKNPAIENGRPIHFNVNLEEDVPALLASIQLSSKVTDIVKKRLQERLQKKSSNEATP